MTLYSRLLECRRGRPGGLRYGVSNGPISFEMDSSQYVVVAAGDTIYSFVMH
jgi:hypothetical protein